MKRIFYAEETTQEDPELTTLTACQCNKCIVREDKKLNEAGGSGRSQRVRRKPDQVEL